MAEMSLDAQGDASGGINTFVHCSQVPKDMAVGLLNADIAEPGVVRKRRGLEIAGNDFGSAKVLACKGYRLLSGVRQLLAVDSTNIWKYEDSGAWSIAHAHGLTITDAEILVCNDLAVVLNDGANQISWNQSDQTDYDTDTNDMPVGTTVGCWHKNRLLVGKNDQIYWSGSLNFADDQWNQTTNTHKIDKGTGQVVKRIWEFDKDMVLVFYDGSIHAINTAPSVGSWEATKIPGQGTIAKRSVCQYGQEAFYLNRNGFWRIGGQYPLTRSLENGWMERVNWQYAHKAAATVWKNRILLALPVDGATENNYVFVYHILNDNNREGRGWAIWHSDKLQISDWATFDFNNVHKLYGGSSRADGVVYEVETDDNYADDGTAYNFEYETRGFVLEAPMNDKTWDSLEVTAQTRQEESIVLKTSVSEEENDYIRVYDESGGNIDLARELTDLDDFGYGDFNFGNDFLMSGFFGLDQFDRGKYIQFKIENSQLDVPVDIHRVSCAAIIQPYRRTAY